MKTDEVTTSTLFDRAMQLRERERFAEAIAVLEEAVGPDVLQRQPSSEKMRTLLAHSLVQLGLIQEIVKNETERLRRFRDATALAPTLELASLGLFHALFDQGLIEDALVEAVRFLSLRDSELYRELLSGDGFREDLSPHAFALAKQARELLARHGQAN